MRRLAAALVLCAAMIGCAESSATFTLPTTDANVTGTFSLVAANGQPLPIVAQLTPTEQWNLSADKLVLDTLGKWTETTTYTVLTLASGATRDTLANTIGTYAIANGQINFIVTTPPGGGFTGSVTGKTLTLLYSGGTFQYTR